MKLCLALGKTRNELLSQMDAPELMRWVAYNQLEPLPDPWLQTGLMCSATANFSLRGARETSPDDWIPRAREKKRQGGAEAFKTLLDLAASRRKSGGSRDH